MLSNSLKNNEFILNDKTKRTGPSNNLKTGMFEVSKMLAVVALNVALGPLPSDFNEKQHFLQPLINKNCP